MRADLAVVCERMHKLIRVKELAAYYQLEITRCLGMPEDPATWNRRIIAERHERILSRLYAGYGSDPFILMYTTILDGPHP